MTTAVPAHPAPFPTGAGPVPGPPAGVGVSHVRVYSSRAPDGQCGGTPHVHLACTEMYVVLEGSGAAEFLTPSGFERVELRPHAAVTFDPGTLHRLVSDPGDDLKILVIMENSHLNERGDVVFTFPDEDLADAQRYEAMADADAPDAVRARRDRAVSGFTALTAAWQHGPDHGRAALLAFYDRAAALVRPRAADWPRLVADGPARAVHRLAERAEAAAAGAPAHLADASVTRLPAPGAGTDRAGFCGEVHRYRPVP
ncbi:cupin [Streptomyces sp. NPDC089915]|uniref:cupin domain-containing protein n=1 Tax=Streptomyces sp. NPDC089915 TaxID=3155186 RepID=UPI003436600D